MSDPGKMGGRLLDACFAILLSAMALYGAVAIIQGIWVFLCVALAVMVFAAGIGLVAFRRWNRF